MINMIGLLPRRVDSSPYPLRGINNVDTLTCHYLGDPIKKGSVLGYGIVLPYNTANYQVTKDYGDPFPEIAYTWQIDPDGTTYQFHEIEKETWHVGSHNYHTRGVLFTGFGIKGQPTPQAIVSLVNLWIQLEKDINRPLSLKGHKQVNPNSECPGELCEQWIDTTHIKRLEMSFVPEKADIPGFSVKGNARWWCDLTNVSLEYRALEFYRANNGLFWLGYPRTEWIRENNTLSKWFQRGRLEIKPEHILPSGTVNSNIDAKDLFQLGLVGDEILAGRN